MSAVDSISTEIWKPVVGYEGIYEVSFSGKIRRAGKARGGVVGAVLSTYSRRGYLLVHLWNNRHHKSCSVHLLVAAAFLGPTPAGMEINHKDGNRGNPSADNLEFVTHSENLRHAVATGLIITGENHHSAKLTDAEVQEIRRLHASGTIGYKRLGRKFHVTWMTIREIIKGRNWRQLPV